MKFIPDKRLLHCKIIYMHLPYYSRYFKYHYRQWKIYCACGNAFETSLNINKIVIQS